MTTRTQARPASRGHRINGEVEKLAAERSSSHAGEIGFVAGVAFAAAVVLLIIQNRSTVNFEWLVFDFATPLWIMLGAAFVTGIIVGPLLVAAWRRHEERRARRRAIVENARTGAR